MAPISIWRRRIVGSAALALLAGCAPPPSSRTTSSGEEMTDVGIGVLASVENARVAIRRRDGVAARDDLLLARGYARRMMARPSPIFAGLPVDEGVRQTKSFAVLSALVAAQGEIERGQFADAADGLQRIEASATVGSQAPDLALLRVRDGLNLAAAAGTTARRTQVISHLLAAQAALAGDVATPKDRRRQALLRSVSEALIVSTYRAAPSVAALEDLSGRATDIAGSHGLPSADPMAL